MPSDGTDQQPHDYDVDERYAHIRVEVLGQTFTDVVRVCEQMPELPDGVTVYVEHVDAVDLKRDDSTGADLDVPTRTIGELEKLPNWATRCRDCGVVHDQVTECPVCSLRTGMEQKNHP